MRAPTAENGHPRHDDLVLEHLALAESVAHRFYRRDSARDEDILQVAYIGLIKAARRFDRSKGEIFAAFAVPTISGEIKRHLRDNGWFVRPPRRLQELRARVGEALPRLTQTLGRMPTVAELASDLDESTAAVKEAIACQQNLYPASLDQQVGEDRAATLGDVLPEPADQWESVEIAALLWMALRELSPRERRVLQLRFFEDCTQQEIAHEMGVTQMQVSRILSKTLSELRSRFVAASASAERQTA